MTIDYKAMPSHEMVQACGQDAHKWAQAFCQFYPPGSQAPDLELVIGWFANAMMTMWDVTNSNITHDDAALCDHISNLVRNRDLWRELAERPA